MPDERQEDLKSSAPEPRQLGLLLSQIGRHAGLAFGRRIARFGISPPHVGILRWIHVNAGRNQRQLASHLGVLPSRLVVLLDELEAKGLVMRQRSAQDRRSQQLLLTKKGARILEKVERIATVHEADLSAALTESERKTLIELCAKLAAYRGLTPHGHPGYGEPLAARGSTRRAKASRTPEI